MSLHSYQVSRELAKHDYPFSSLVMAAMRKADTDNQVALAFAFPKIWEELEARYHAPGGYLQSELEQTIEINCQPCPRCGKRGLVVMPVAAHKSWQDGVAIQWAWPEGSNGDRELLITGYHDACFNSAFPPDGEGFA